MCGIPGPQEIPETNNPVNNEVQQLILLLFLLVLTFHGLYLEQKYTNLILKCLHQTKMVTT